MHDRRRSFSLSRNAIANEGGKKMVNLLERYDRAVLSYDVTMLNSNVKSSNELSIQSMYIYIFVQNYEILLAKVKKN